MEMKYDNLTPDNPVLGLLLARPKRWNDRIVVGTHLAIGRRHQQDTS